MALQPGATLGPYEILSLIGAGGMGEVYRARDPRLNREVAIKVLPADRVGDQGRRRRFVQEAHAASALNHPHIITIHQIEAADGNDFIVMEYVRGKSLGGLIPRHGMRLGEVLRIAIPVADALAAAHARGIIHRDLKPANVMVGTDGAVKVLDFGLAKLLGREVADEADLTHTADVALSELGTIVGTAAYMAPEQASGGNVDARSDIFSFGAMLYEMVTGVRAFAGTSTANTLAAVLRAQPKPPTAIVPGVPPDLEKVILRCVRKDPERRFQHMADVKVALQEIKEDFESATGLAGVPVAPTRRGRLIATLAGTTLLIAAVAGLGFWLGGRRTTTTLPDHSVARLTMKLEGQTAADLRLLVHGFFVPLALSPDGTRLVFRALGPKGSQLFLRELAGVEARALPGTELATTPFFSPDGRWVGFWTAEDRILQKVSVSGGPPIEIAPTNAPITALWGASDEIVIETAVPSTLWSIPANGGTPLAIVVRDRSEEEMISLRARIPGRSDLLVASIRPGEAWLEVLSRETGRRRRLLRGGGSVGAVYAARTGHLVYADADTLFAVPVDSTRFEPVGAPAPAIHGIDHFYWHTNVALAENGTIVYLPAERVREAELVWRDRAGNVTPVPGGRGPFVSGTLSPDGREAVGQLVEGTKSEVWVVDMERGAKRLLVSEGENRTPIWSRDGAFVTYGSIRGGKAALYRRRADGTGSEERLAGSRLGWPSPEEWSPDGRSLLFTGVTSRGDSDIWIFSGGEPAPLIASPFSETSPRFSPDGRFVAFAADDGGVSHVYIQPFPGPGPRTTVSVEEGHSPRWGWSGGRQLFYESRGRNDSRGRMMVVTVQTAPVLRVGQPKLPSEQDIPSRGLVVTRDGPRFLDVSRRTPVEGPLELRVVLNWFEELERIAPHPRR